jgi:hypothetical protein
MAIKQDRPYEEIVPQDIAEIRDELNAELDQPLPEPGWYIGRIVEDDGANGNGYE